MNNTAIPEVGMGCTVYYYSDRAAATVIAVTKAGRKVSVQLDAADRTDSNGMSEAQEYIYTRDPKAEIKTFYRTADGTYTARGCSLGIGTRRTYHDYSL